MLKKSQHLPVNTLPQGTSHGITMMREAFDGPPNFQEIERSHRDGGYAFLIQEKGSTHIEIDFQTYNIQAPSIVVIKPNKVHRVIIFAHASVSTSIITE